jgi:hypothetical protein
MDHQLQQLLDLSLEAEGFFGSGRVLGRGSHGIPLKKQNVPARYGGGQSRFKSMDKAPIAGACSLAHAAVAAAYAG